MRIAITALFICLAFNLNAQKLPNPEYRKVDDFKVNYTRVKVFFKDPLAVLVTSLPDFDNKPDAQKTRLLDVYMQNHEVYLFSATSKDGKVTSYVLRGDPEKKEASDRYQVAVTDGDIQGEATASQPRKYVKDIVVAGDFFEHMAPFQLPQYKKLTTTQVWGNIVHINPYAPIKEAVTKIIAEDQHQ